ncbi:sialidase (neuraminidase) family protein-like protein [Brachyspira pilosicoli WesB]|uniref:Sialidase (Neuraminidase) family protein-like protein n=1 Tax=Brachyspira pilosicoli WesB TaxID=1161918 RepID=K0JHP9_BRAPL|nr:sialidase family protein [Brachyspira pilosicoli]CCG56392.1 sialidase (neuraminidase) family protein-like protein [Brachyspira pilosicoli WesB]
MKKYILSYLFLLIIILLIAGCGTDYLLSSFYIRNKDLKWLVSPSEQASIDTKYQVTGELSSQNTSPSILVTPANYIIVLYEHRTQNILDIIGVDGYNTVDVYSSISLNAENFVSVQVVGGKYSISSSDSHGSPIGFVDNNGNVVVLAVKDFGFGNDNDKDKLTPISVSISSNNGKSWTAWADIDTNTFNTLKEKGYNRYYTNPGNGKRLKNGTLACIIDYRKHNNDGKNKADGFAIFYSTNNGKDWQIGAAMNYSGYSHRFARIIAENSDGSLLIGAVPNTGNDAYNTNKDLAWYKLDSLNGTITPITVTGLPKNNGGTISGDNCIFVKNGYSKRGILLAHSFPNRKWTNPAGNVINIPTSSALSISEDEGKSWKLITNIVGTGPIDKASFRQSLMVLKDGTIANAYEEGDGSEINATYSAFFIVYRRFSLEAVSKGTYRYEGI